MAGARFWIMIGVLVALAPLARAQAPGQALVHAPAPLPVVAVQEEIAKRLAAGDGPGAFAAIDRSTLSDVDKAFLAGRVLQAQGRHAEAAQIYGQVLRVRPDLHPFRKALVRSLIALGDWPAAMRELDTLLQVEENPRERAEMLRLRREVEARRPGGLSFGVSLAPSTNVNRATSNIEAPSLGGLEGTIDETRESGIGLTFSASAFRRAFLGQGRVLEGALSVAFTGFTDAAYNRATVTGSLSYTQPAKRGRWRTRAAISEYLYRDPIDRARRFSLTQTRSWNAENGRFWEVAGSIIRTDYRDPSRAGYDSYGADLSLATRRALGPASWLTLTSGLAYTDARDDRFTFLSPRIGFEIGAQVGEAWILSAGPVLTYRAYDEIFGGLFPVSREDKSFGLRLGVQNTNFRIRGAVPRLSCLLEKTNSNIVFYDNRNVIECSIGLSRQF